MVIRKGKTSGEHKRDVRILLDRSPFGLVAYTVGYHRPVRFLPVVLMRTALHVERFVWCARNINEGASLTIIATALIDTGSAGRSHLSGFKGPELRNRC